MRPQFGSFQIKVAVKIELESGFHSVDHGSSLPIQEFHLFRPLGPGTFSRGRGSYPLGMYRY